MTIDKDSFKYIELRRHAADAIMDFIDEALEKAWRDGYLDGLKEGKSINNEETIK